MSEQSAIPNGARIARYTVTAAIGAGGMGEVYKASDASLGRSVALKVLPAELLQSPDRVRRFVQEAKSASALNHPHIVTIYEIGQVEMHIEGDPRDGSPVHYIAMEFIDGDTLKGHIRRDTDLKKLMEVMAQSADGLAKAHDAGIVHRDLKPDNIMITNDGYAKVVDFGLAKLTEKAEGQGNIEKTQEGVVMGTAGYMSPEQVQGKIVDQRSDIFSFGCILYECATKKKPFQSDTAIDMMHRIVFSQPDAIVQHEPDAPQELQRIIAKCLEKSPEDRYHSIREIAVDLKRLIRTWDSQPTVSGRTPTAPGSFGAPAGSGSGGYAVPSPSGSGGYPVSGSQPGVSTPPDYLPAGGAVVSGSQPSWVPEPRPERRDYGPWIRRGIILAILLFAAAIWYTHPEVEGLAGVPPATTAVIEQRRDLPGVRSDIGLQWTPLKSIGEQARVATLAAHDPEYLEQPDLTLEELQKAGVIGDLWREKRFPGMSGISRSVARNVWVPGFGPIDRLRQFLIAIDLERNLSRDEIFELYLNTAEFGPNVFGIEAASKRYFDKPSSKLTREQAATLAAAASDPANANPKEPAEWLIARRDQILDTMKK